MQNRTLRTVFFSIIALCAVAGVTWIQAQEDQARSLNSISPLADSFGGPFTLVNQDGETVTEKNYAGRHKLVFFGFTYCPAVCPTELQKMTDALEALGPDEADAITPIFITTDPERDTPDVVKKYLKNFDKRIIGLTGTREQIDPVLKSYKVYASKIEMPGMDGYMMDHSAFTYLIDPQEHLLSIYKTEDTGASIARDIQAKLRTATN